MDKKLSRASRQIVKVSPSRKIGKIQRLCYGDPEILSMCGLCVSMGMCWLMNMEVSNGSGVGARDFIEGARRAGSRSRQIRQQMLLKVAYEDDRTNH